MTSQQLVRIAIPLGILILFVVMTLQFFFGDLGIVEAWEKQRTIAALQADIEAGKAAGRARILLLKKLENDRATIRSYALLYGMTGGQEYPATPITGENSGKPGLAARPAAAEKESLFIRHPVLGILLAAILLAAATLCLRVCLRRKKTGSTDSERPGSRNRCIRPSWTN